MDLRYTGYSSVTEDIVNKQHILQIKRKLFIKPAVNPCCKPTYSNLFNTKHLLNLSFIGAQGSDKPQL